MARAPLPWSAGARRRHRPARSPTRRSRPTAAARPRAIDSDVALREGVGEGAPGGEGAAARGRAVHALLEWSQANGWRQPPADLIERISASAEVGADAELAAEDLLEPFRAWLGSGLFAERVRGERSRAEVPVLVARRRHRPARLDRPAGRAAGIPAADRRLQDRQARRRRARRARAAATRSSGRSTRSRSPRPWTHPRSRSPTSSSSAPTSRSSSSGRPPRSRRAAAGSRRPSPRSPGL